MSEFAGRQGGGAGGGNVLPRAVSETDAEILP
jgi:hypothetical protein